VLVARSAQASEALIDAASLGGEVGFAVINLRTGQLLESRKPALAMPPASVAKTITTLYALDQLGPGHRFATRLIATGPLAGGRIEGDLVLAGGGDATLHTDHLATMASELRAAGVSSIAGRFLVWGGTLPYTREIAHDQPEYVGYNPAVSGLNLNFNRVFFEWKANGAGYELSVDARSEKVVPRVNMARVSVVAPHRRLAAAAGAGCRCATRRSMRAMYFAPLPARRAPRCRSLSRLRGCRAARCWCSTKAKSFPRCCATCCATRPTSLPKR
jgi:D-alanyl-D-alanine carboxypeptidase/D-alanyl-D-alanine-endopeptidase (penicillin-binding protein 4)